MLDEWSGDFLNYLTTARIDALRKVLYGGKRSRDDALHDALERTHIPQDAHSWGKEYRSIAVDGYDIRNYTPLACRRRAPSPLREHDTARHCGPLLRVLTNQTGTRLGLGQHRKSGRRAPSSPASTMAVKFVPA